MVDQIGQDGPLDLESLPHSDTIGAELEAARTEPAPQSAVIPTAPPEPAKEPEEVQMAKRLHKMGWNPELSIRATCRILGEPEGGVRFLTVKDALVVLRAMYEQDSAAILARLREMEWDPDRPYLEAVKALGFAEKGYWLTLVESAVVLLQQDALQEAEAIEAELAADLPQDPAPASKPTMAMASVEPKEGWTMMQRSLHWHPQGTQKHKDPGEGKQGD
ncbi:MAG: hypothetical protein GWN58_07525, partial [Anaerolineae bacterium]|nr:hypothetical protein [Anaerolineae bacterium]